LNVCFGRAFGFARVATAFLRDVFLARDAVRSGDVVAGFVVRDFNDFRLLLTSA
jgi:hypothetical protein